jgi:zinc protease
VDKTSDLTKTKDVLLDVVESLASNPITKDEVDRVKRSLIKNIELASNSSERIALDLSEWLAMGDWRLYFLNRDRIEAVTLEDVQRVANTYLVRNNRTLGQFIPSETAERVTIPAVASVADMVEGYTGRKQVAQGELFEPSFDNIAKRSEVIAFKNGTKAVMLDKKTRGESVSLSMMFQYGNLDKLMKQMAQFSEYAANSSGQKDLFISNNIGAGVKSNERAESEQRENNFQSELDPDLHRKDTCKTLHEKFSTFQTGDDNDY